MAEHTVFDCIHWEQRVEINSFFGGRHVLPSDVDDILCGPHGIPIYDESPDMHLRMTDAAARCRVSFVKMVKEILMIKEGDERKHEVQGE